VAHFAELDENNTVLRVIVVSNEDTADEDGNEVEAIGITFCQNLLGGTWVQTSYNDNMRRQYASIGYTYDPDADIFITPPPYPSWIKVIGEHTDWEPPTPRPDGDDWYWEEVIADWVEFKIPAES
tara:strand:+ start:107 stop:481 length:375 start_codon:yes stop_codon:yes gene_type:complete